jgi:hypothetical protein
VGDTPGEGRELVAQSELFFPPPPPPDPASFEYTFDEAGEYTYICTLHPTQMVGSLTVTEPGGEDTTPPVTTAALDPPDPGPGGTYDGPVEVTLSATDNAGGSGVASTEYNLDGAGFQPYTAPFTVADEGAHTVVYRSTDVAGNVESDKQVAFTIDPGGGGEADLNTAIRPRTKRVKPNHQAAFTVALENVGGAAANEVKVCAKAPSRLVKTTGGRCWTRMSVAAGATPSTKFTFKPKRRARGKRVRIRFTTSSQNGGGGTYTATLKVARR